MPIVFQRNKKMGNKFRFDVNIKTKDWFLRIPVDKLKWKVREVPNEEPKNPDNE